MDEDAGSSSVTEITGALKGSWCAVRYDNDIFPEIVQDVDENDCVLVNTMTMTQAGQNRFYWPMREDIIWYQPHDFLCLIPPPQPVTKRHMMLQKDVWEKLCSRIDA